MRPKLQGLTKDVFRRSTLKLMTRSRLIQTDALPSLLFNCHIWTALNKGDHGVLSAFYWRLAYILQQPASPSARKPLQQVLRESDMPDHEHAMRCARLRYIQRLAQNGGDSFGPWLRTRRSSAGLGSTSCSTT